MRCSSRPVPSPRLSGCTSICRILVNLVSVARAEIALQLACVFTDGVERNAGVFRAEHALEHGTRVRFGRALEMLACARKRCSGTRSYSRCRVRLNRDIYTTQSRFGSFTYRRFTVPQEVHKSAKRLSLLSPSGTHPRKRFFFCLQRRPGRTSPRAPEAEAVRPLMRCEPPPAVLPSDAPVTAN